MKVSGLLGLSVLVAASLATAVMAEGDAAVPAATPQAEKKDMFKKADANADGKLTLEEFKTMAKGDAEKKFTAADTDKDGFVTPEELKAARAAKKATPAVPAPVVPVK